VQLAIELGEGPYCSDCPIRSDCGYKAGPRACQPIYGEPRYGGVNVIHPLRPDLRDYFDEVNGPRFDVVARPSQLPSLSLTLPRIYPRRELNGYLRRGFYAVGADEAIIKRRQVLSADELREITGLWSDQLVALVLFGKDSHLEQVWARRRKIVSEISECGYDFVTPPSYSALINHPPSENMLNLKRSFAFFELLQDEGVPTAPRLAWVSDHDVDRAAQWCGRNEHVSLVVLDLAIKHRLEWRRQLRLLSRFDQLTGQRLKYLVHGPQVENRLIEIFSVLGRRAHISGSRAISRPREHPRDVDRFAAEEEAAAYRALLQVSEDSSCSRPRRAPMLPRQISRAELRAPDKIAA